MRLATFSPAYEDVDFRIGTEVSHKSEQLLVELQTYNSMPSEPEELFELDL